MGSMQLPFERLRGRENFSTWCVGAKAQLITKGHWKEMSVDVAALKDEASKTSNEKALAELTLLLDSGVYYIHTSRTAKPHRKRGMHWQKHLKILE